MREAPIQRGFYIPTTARTHTRVYRIVRTYAGYQGPLEPGTFVTVATHANIKRISTDSDYVFIPYDEILARLTPEPTKDA